MVKVRDMTGAFAAGLRVFVSRSNTWKLPRGFHRNKVLSGLSGRLWTFRFHMTRRASCFGKFVVHRFLADRFRTAIREAVEKTLSLSTFLPQKTRIPKAHMKCSCDVRKQSVDTWWAQAADIREHFTGCFFLGGLCNNDHIRLCWCSLPIEHDVHTRCFRPARVSFEPLSRRFVCSRINLCFCMTVCQTS